MKKGTQRTVAFDRLRDVHILVAVIGDAEAHPAIVFMQQFLYFLPLPQGQGSLRPTRAPRWRIGSCFFSVCCWLPWMAAICWAWMLPSGGACMAGPAASWRASVMAQTDSWKPSA